MVKDKNPDQLFRVITDGGRRDSGETDLAMLSFKLDFTRIAQMSIGES